MKTLNWKVVTHWAVTGLFAALMLLSASMYLSGAATIREVLSHLGYPAYLLTILGVAKLFGAIALVQTRWPRLREWAYAGFVINLVGATASHVFAGDAASVAIVPALFLIPLTISYVLRPEHVVTVSAGIRRPVSAAA